MKKILFLLFAVLVIITVIFLIQTGGMNRGVRTQGTDKLQVSTSFYPLYFFASEIGGDNAEVRNITPVGAEPHEYDPSTQEIARIEEGDLLLLNGGMEPWGETILENLTGKEVSVVIVSEGLQSKELVEDGEAMKDPHVWLSPVLAKKMVERITDGYISIDSIHAETYKANSEELLRKLDELDREYREGLASCESRDIITSHAAFAYLADAYSLTQVPISGLSPDEEPSARQLAEIAEFARERSVTAIFFESLISPKLADTIAGEIGATTLVLDPLEGLSEDDIRQGENYFTVMRDNLKNLQTALRCKN